MKLTRNEKACLDNDQKVALFESAKYKITAEYAQRHLEQCEKALSDSQEKCEKLQEQLKSVCNHNALQQIEINRLRTELYQLKSM